MVMRGIAIVLILAATFSGCARAEIVAPAPRPDVRMDTPSGLPVPRFVSLGAAPANARYGPSREHPVKWRLLRKGAPLEVIAETEMWRKVRDPEGGEAWLHKSLLNGRRTAIVRPGADSGPRALYGVAGDDTTISAYLDAGVIVRVTRAEGEWREISVHRRQGWVPSEALWGVYTDETFENR